MHRLSRQSVPIRDTYLGLFDGPHATPKPSNDGPVFLGIGNISEDGRLDLAAVRHIAEEDFAKWTKRVLPGAGDIVFTYEATLNRYAIIPKGFRGCLGRRLALIRPNPEVVDTRFLHFYFFSAAWRETIALNTLSGATVDRVPLTKFPAFPVQLPSLIEQRRIASILSAYDDLIENNTRRIAILEEMARRLYEEWFVRFRFPGFEAVRMVESELGPVPEGWLITRFTDVFDVRYGKTLPTKDLTTDGQYPVYGAGGVIGRHNDFVIDGPVCLITSRGNGSGTIWRSVERAFVTNNSFIVKPKASFQDLSFGFAELFAGQANVKTVVSGAAQPQLTIDSLTALKVIGPDRNLLLHFDVLISPLFDLANKLHFANTNLRTTRDLLLPKLISGELDVSTLPLPEPALA